MGRRLKSLLLSTSIVLIVTVVLVEVVLRLAGFSHVAFYRPDDELGLRLRANVEGRFSSEGDAFVRTNSAGFRDRERTEEKPAGRFRIAVLGDSYIEAMQVDLDDAFPALL